MRLEIRNIQESGKKQDQEKRMGPNYNRLIMSYEKI